MEKHDRVRQVTDDNIGVEKQDTAGQVTDDNRVEKHDRAGQVTDDNIIEWKNMTEPDRSQMTI